MNDKIEIYSAQVCPFAQRTLILLKEKKIEYSLIEIDLDNKPKSFTEISPFGKVPLITHQGRHIFESKVINEYLEEVFPSPSLLSKDPAEKAFMRIWMSYCDSDFIPAYYKLLLTQDETQQKQLKEQLLNALFFIENEGMAKYSNGDYFFGDELSLVDITFYPFFERFVTNEYYRGTTIPTSCKRIRRWVKIMRERASVIETGNSPEFYIERYKKYSDGSTPRSGAKRILDDLWG